MFRVYVDLALGVQKSTPQDWAGVVGQTVECEEGEMGEGGHKRERRVRARSGGGTKKTPWKHHTVPYHNAERVNPNPSLSGA